MTGPCFLCGRYAPLERHHVFGGARRKKAEKYGLVVELCHSCHNEPPHGAHFDKDTALYLHQWGQRKVMLEQGWSTHDFIREFGKNYL